jgi:hypothetical protein
MTKHVNLVAVVLFAIALASFVAHFRGGYGFFTGG